MDFDIKYNAGLDLLIVSLVGGTEAFVPAAWQSFPVRDFSACWLAQQHTGNGESCYVLVQSGFSEGIKTYIYKIRNNSAVCSSISTKTRVVSFLLDVP